MGWATSLKPPYCVKMSHSVGCCQWWMVFPPFYIRTRLVAWFLVGLVPMVTKMVCRSGVIPFLFFLFLQYLLWDVLFLTLSNSFSSILQSLHINSHKLEFPCFAILHFQFGVEDLFPSSAFNYVRQWWWRGEQALSVKVMNGSRTHSGEARND